MSRLPDMMQTVKGMRQQGSVLIISLMFMLVLTLIGIATVSSTTLETRMSRNFQHAMLAFQGAETAIQDVIVAGDQNSTTPAYNQNTDPLNQALTAGAGANVQVAAAINAPPAPSINANSTVAYTGIAGGLCPGDSVDETSTFGCNAFSVTTQANIVSTGTSTTHIQGVVRSGPK